MMRFSSSADRLFVGLFCVLLISGCEFLQPPELVYVTASALNLRQKPTTKSRVMGRLERGQELKVVEKGDPWLQVRVDPQTVGWVHGDYVGDPAAVRAALQKDLSRRPSTSRPRTPSHRPSTSPKPRTKGAMSIDGMIEGLPEDLVIEEMDPLEGQPRHMGAVESGQVVLEFQGQEEDLLRAEMMVSVVNVADEDLDRNAGFVLTFVRNAVPQWKRDADWVANLLRGLSSQDKGSGGFDARSKTVRFLFIKPLGAIRVTIEKTA